MSFLHSWYKMNQWMCCVITCQASLQWRVVPRVVPLARCEQAHMTVSAAVCARTGTRGHHTRRWGPTSNLHVPTPSPIWRLRRAGMDTSKSNLDELLTVTANFFGSFLPLSGVGFLDQITKKYILYCSGETVEKSLGLPGKWRAKDTRLRTFIDLDSKFLKKKTFKFLLQECNNSQVWK